MNPIKISLEQGTQEWLEYRYDHLGASEASIILGVNPWNTPHDLWKRKIERKEVPVNEAMLKGQALEPVARDLFNLIHGYECKPAVFQHSEITYMSASLDGWDEEKKTAVEIKCGGKKLYEDCRLGHVPAYYMAQLQHIMYVMGLESMFYCVYSHGDISVLEIKKDNDMQKEIVHKEAEFWIRIVNIEAPPKSEEDYVSIDTPKFKELGDEYRALKMQVDLENKRLKSLKDWMIDMTDGLSVQGFGIKLRKTKPSTKVDYKAYVESLGVQEEELKPFTKYVDGHWMIILDKE